jgi:nicotinamidase-related amidase
MKSANGVEIPETLRELVNPKHCALIVYDMQVGILRQIKNGGSITAGVKQVLDVARTAGMRVFYTRHLSLPRRLMGMSQLRQAMAWQRVDDPEKVQPWFLRDSPAFQT